MSLFDTAERFASIDRSQIILHAERCLHSLDSASNCMACTNLCPVNAITAGKPPTLEAETCQTCLACLQACPVGALSADDDVSPLLNCVSHLENKAVELVCGLHPQPGTSEHNEDVGIRIRGCLAGLGTGGYLLLAALGLERIILRTDACSTCKWGSLGGQIKRQAEGADRFLAGWNKTDSIVCLDHINTPVERPVWDEHNPPLSRRDLFRLLARQGQVAMARAMENGMTTLKRQPGRDRLRLLSAKSHLPEPPSGPAVNLDGFGFATLKVSKDCTACGACAKACPTEALHFEKSQDDTAFTLSFSPQKCTGCDLCAHVCAPDAIAVEHAPTFDDIFGAKEPVVVETGELARCAKCNSLMAARPGVRLCPLCEYRREHPFGSILPGQLKSKYKNNREEQHS